MDGQGGGHLAALLGVMAGDGAVDPEAERQALAAFRAVRDAGALRARTRRRDDWRSRGDGR
ncbi:hypothetical protein [Streptomyces sp. NPDC047706]|uniref:hypothetical protein n=1 Tax=Streptomyces sp. NPDC047706 TaxID=3365486 RepID=UPI00371E4A40